MAGISGLYRHWSSHSSVDCLQMDRLNHVTNIKQEDDEDQKKVPINNNAKQLEELSSRHDNTSLSNIFIKQEFDYDEHKKIIIKNAQQKHSVRRCTKVKKEEEGGVIKLEWDGDECDCEECRVEREIKIEFNEMNEIKNQSRVNLPEPSNASKGASSQCKRVKKEEEHDEEWDEDCDCDQCRRMRLKVIPLKLTNATDNRKDGGECNAVDGKETEVEKEGDGSEAGLWKDGDLDEACSQSDESEDDETEIDDDEYEMDDDDEESSDDVETEMDEQSDQESDYKLPDEKQVCKYCGKKFYRLARHILTHTGEKPFKCTWKGCKKTFPRKDNMKVHYATHIGKRPFKCSWDGCNKTFTQKFKMQTHYKAHTKLVTIGLPNVCELCEVRCHSLSNLKIHLRTHTGEKPYKCTWKKCNKIFICVSELNLHRRIHTGDFPYKCNWLDCGLKFLRVAELKSHSRVHSDEKPFACNMEGCTSKYKHKADLLKHQRTKHNYS